MKRGEKTGLQENGTSLSKKQLHFGSQEELHKLIHF
jgi:hypothetical protein